MRKHICTFKFSDKASYPKNALALMYDLEGFSRFFNQPDVQNYVPAFLNHVSEAMSVVLFSGNAYWTTKKKITVLFPFALFMRNLWVTGLCISYCRLQGNLISKPLR